MVTAIIEITDHANRVLNIVKAMHWLKDKSEAINVMAQVYQEDVLEPELGKAYVKKLSAILKSEKRVKIKNFAKEFGLE